GGTLEYHLWRTPGASFNYSGIPVAAVQGGQRQVYDYPAPFTNWNGVNSFLQAPSPASTSTSGSNLASAVVPTAGSGPAGFSTGVTYTYQISAVVRRNVATSSNSTGSTSGTSQEDVETSPVNSGAATPISQPLANTPLAGRTSVNLSAVNFTWQSVSGADV